MPFRRTPVRIFQLGNPLYANAVVSFFAIDVNGNPTTTLIPLYTTPAGVTAAANPQHLDSNGRLTFAVFHDQPFVAKIGASEVPDHQTAPWYPDHAGFFQGDWVTAFAYIAGDTVRDAATDNVYECQIDHVSGVLATDIGAGKWGIVLNMVAANAAVTAAAAQATIATTQAGIATTEAGIATTQAGIATTEAGIATTQAGIATTAAAANLASMTGASTTAMTIGAGTFSPNIGVGKQVALNEWVQFVSAASSANFMFGQITAYNSTTGAATYVVPSNGVGGSGSHTDWNWAPAGSPGTNGTNGTNGQPSFSGFGLSNDGVTPNTILDIAAGVCLDSTGVVTITGTAFTKKTGGSWVAGTAGNGMGSSLTIALSTWYHVFAIINAGAFDVYFDTSATAANKPVGTTAFRRIGSFKTDGSANIIAFTQRGQWFFWASVVLDLSSGSPATSLTNVTLSVPLGIVTLPILGTTGTAASAADAISLASAGHAGVDIFFSAAASNSMTGAVAGHLFTDTSSRIQYKATSASDTVQIRTVGWIDFSVSPVM